MPLGVAIRRGRRMATTQSVPETRRRGGDPAPARCRHQRLGEVRARPRKVRVLHGRDQDPVRGEAPPFLSWRRRGTCLRHGPVRRAAAAQPDDAGTSFATFLFHSAAHPNSRTRLIVPLPKSRRTGVDPVDDLPVELREPQRLVGAPGARINAVRHPTRRRCPSRAAKGGQPPRTRGVRAGTWSRPAWRCGPRPCVGCPGA